jgi:hypothetical protein
MFHDFDGKIKDDQKKIYFVLFHFLELKIHL